MQEPSDNWHKLRNAALERAERTTVDPLLPIYRTHLFVCVFYLAGFLHLTFFDYGHGFTWIAGFLVVCVAFFGALVPFLTGSLLTLRFTHQRFRELLSV